MRAECDLRSTYKYESDQDEKEIALGHTSSFAHHRWERECSSVVMRRMSICLDIDTY